MSSRSCWLFLSASCPSCHWRIRASRRWRRGSSEAGCSIKRAFSLIGGEPSGPVTDKVLLISIEYDEQSMTGPPFSVPDQSVRELYERGFDVDLIEEIRGPEVAGRLRLRGLQTMVERAYRLQRRPG